MSLFSRLMHRHDYKCQRRWCYINDDLICQRWYRCDCGSEIDKVNLLVAAARDLAEADSRRITTGNKGVLPCGAAP